MEDVLNLLVRVGASLVALRAVLSRIAAVRKHDSTPKEAKQLLYLLDHPMARRPANIPSEGKMNRGYIYTDTASRGKKTALDFYSQKYTYLSRDQWLRHFHHGRIKFLGKRRRVIRRKSSISVSAGETKLQEQSQSTTCPADKILRPGDRVAYHKPPWREPPAPPLSDIKIIYQDADLIVVDKPAGLQVLPGGGFQDSTLLGALKQAICPEACPVHRLGRGTSGLLLCAKTQRARAHLADCFKQCKLKKIYRLLAEGIVDADKEKGFFDIKAPIGPLKGGGHHNGINCYRADGKTAWTRFRVVRRDFEKQQTVLEADIKTGRPHQIRIHSAFAGHPLVADPFFVRGGMPYRVKDDSDVEGGGYPAREHLPRIGDIGYWLHSREISFPHPSTGKIVKFCSSPPEVLR
mmetsp:Transcript_21058/g.33959  ORF Transcript_21058/g.33959 Transcript_21058/m.33959 type:complete len:406 (+) Transcript_21058:32-1249(+)